VIRQNTCMRNRAYSAGMARPRTLAKTRTGLPVGIEFRIGAL
jgi:hypothetical protein